MKVQTLALLASLLVVAVPVFADTQPLTRLPVPREAPDFSAEDTRGDTRTLGDYRGNVLIVNFWATWCAPCVIEMPSLQRAWEQLRQEDGILVLAINMGQSREDIARFTEKYPLDFPVLLDKTVLIADSWSVQGLPTTYVVDPRGRIVFEAIGDREWDDPDLLAPVRALKSKPAAQMDRPTEPRLRNTKQSDGG